MAHDFLDDDLIGEAGFFYVLDARHQGVDDVQLAPCLVETFRGDADDQVIAEGFGPLQEAVMALMEEVECAVCDDFDHAYPSFITSLSRTNR